MQKSIWQNPAPFHDKKTLNRIEGNLLNLTKDIYEKLTTNIIMVKILLHKEDSTLLRTKQGLSKCFHSCGLSSLLLLRHAFKNKEVLGLLRIQAQLPRERISRDSRGASWGRGRKMKRGEKRAALSLCLGTGGPCNLAWRAFLLSHLGCPSGPALHSLASTADPEFNLVKEMIQVVAAEYSPAFPSNMLQAQCLRLPPGYRDPLESVFLSSVPCSKPLRDLSSCPPPSSWGLISGC